MHPSVNSVAACVSCGKGVCVACAVEIDDKMYCRQCVCKLLKQAKREREAALAKEKKPVVALQPSSAWVGPEPDVIYPPTVCYRHPKVASVTVCRGCGNGICAACSVDTDDGLLCRSCAMALIKKAQPAQPASNIPSAPAISIAALGTIAAAQAKAHEEAPGEPEPAVADNDRKFPPLSIAALGTIAAQAKATEVAKSTPQSPMATEQQSPALSIAALGVIAAAKAGAKETAKSESYTAVAAEPKVPPEVAEVTRVADLAVYEERPPGSYEPRIPLMLSVIMPGYGQIYNGHWKKGITLLIVEMAIWIMVAALFLRYISGDLWIVLLVAGVLILYSGYDAYKSAEKIKNGQMVVDWFS